MRDFINNTRNNTRGGDLSKFPKIPKDKMMRAKNISAKLCFAVLLVFGCQSLLFSGGGGMSGIAHTKSGQKYRCFAEIGKSTHSVRSGNKYCLPTPNTTSCKKEWNWSLDNKEDRATELGTNCNFTCRNDPNFTTTGSSSPYTTYSYCVLESDWNKVAKCVNKNTGQDESESNKCEGDSKGTTYYYKPRCDEGDTKAECLAKLTALTDTLSSTKWRFCYKYSEAPSDMFQQKGGQSVLFVEYKAQNNTTTFPCDQQSTAMVSGETNYQPESADTLVILDEQDGDTKQTISKVHTKISGNDYKFRIFAVDNAGKFSSGLSSLTCTITEKGGATFSAQAKENGFFDAIFGGKGKNYIFGTYSPQSSGEASISCVGTNTSGKQVSASTDFFIAPHSYSYNIINADFDGKSENLMNNTNNKLPLVLDYATNENASKEITHDNDNWNKKPVVKLGGAIQITLAEVQAMSAKNQIDTGVDSANNIGIITATPKVQVKGITDANKTPPNTSNSTCTTANQINPSSVNMTQGKANGGELFIINEANALAGEMEVEILDIALRDTINLQQGMSLCGSATFPCPYPQTLRLKFEYEVVPDDFKIELLDNNGNALKVLYFGQGQTPEIEAGE